MRAKSRVGGCCTVLAILGVIILCIIGMATETGTPPETVDFANTGVALAEAGNYQGAIDFYDRALERYPDNAEIHYNKAVALEHLGQREQAISEYEKSIEIDPNFVEAQTNLAILTMDIINPVTIVVAVLGGSALVISYFRYKKKKHRENRIMQGILQK